MGFEEDVSQIIQPNAGGLGRGCFWPFLAVFFVRRVVSMDTEPTVTPLKYFEIPSTKRSTIVVEPARAQFFTPWRQRACTWLSSCHRSPSLMRHTCTQDLRCRNKLDVLYGSPPHRNLSRRHKSTRPRMTCEGLSKVLLSSVASDTVYTVGRHVHESSLKRHFIFIFF